MCVSSHLGLIKPNVKLKEVCKRKLLVRAEVIILSPDVGELNYFFSEHYLQGNETFF